MGWAVVGQPLQLMAFILGAFFHGRNVTGCESSAKNYTDSISQYLFLSLFLSLSLLRCTASSLALITHLSQSVLVLDFVAHDHA